MSNQTPKPLPLRPTWATIDLDALAFNFRSSKAFIGSDIEYMAVVKANAYGHGAIQCAKRLEAEGVNWFAVASVEEGLELRHAGIRRPILILGGIWSGHEDVIANDLTPAVFTIEQAKSLDEAAKRKQIVLDVHLKIDTGMGRVGFIADDAQNLANQLKTLTNLNVTGMMTHFAAADDLAQNEFTAGQLSRFQQAVEIFRSNRFDPKYIDLANSPGAVAHPQSRSNLVRLGGILYGLGGDVLPAGIGKPELKPVMSVETRVLQVKNVPSGSSIGYSRTFTTNRDSVIATIPIGYHDGFRRSLSNLGSVLVNSEMAPVVGRVSMDWTTIDVTGLKTVSVGDPVTVIGSQGSSEIKAEDIASKLGTISYEITCGISGRVPRIFAGENL
ncbi:MAG TPA: alanine racemase [Pyrinomonadaceae bacterium]|nr:alanine racemase [Pyrinomonadaceae bacterium]